ncbi:hypothetical protein JCM24511_07889 [Saitozyma sp. JCM 24511]|nr:hypothetical protein JCM24511_07889 [Saitozyma sp. JCM 24511]
MFAVRPVPLRLVPGLGRRCSRQSSTLPPPPEVNAWSDELTSRPPRWAKDLVDAQRTSHLQKTLPTRVGPTPLGLRSAGPGGSLPKGHHLVLFQPQTSLDALGRDGSSTEYNPPAPYLRRMWAGGSFQWNPDVTLRIGEGVSECTVVPTVEFKNDMIFVYQEKTLFPDGSDDWAVREIRIHVFRTDVGVKAPRRDRDTGATGPPIPNPTNTFTYTPSSPLLFRYSALTFNGHKIHYDRDWVRDVEGHPDLVVHGPLTSTLLTELAATIASDKGRTLERFDYRATSPMYVDREVTLIAGEDKEGRVQLVAEQEGVVGMKATATLR